MDEMLASPPGNNGFGQMGQTDDQYPGQQNEELQQLPDELEMVAVSFHCDEEPLRKKIFPSQWYQKQAESEEISEEDVPCFTFEIKDYNKIGEMLQMAIEECNKSLEEAQIAYRLKEDISGGEEVYDVYMSKKKNGRPKNDYPSCDYNREVKQMKVKKNRFTVVFTELAIEDAPGEDAPVEQPVQQPVQPVQEFHQAQQQPQPIMEQRNNQSQEGIRETTISNMTTNTEVAQNYAPQKPAGQKKQMPENGNKACGNCLIF